MPLVYDELLVLARAYMRRAFPVQTLQPTALVHEVYLKLAQKEQADWKGRTHFLAVAAWAMRQILVDYARRKRRKKRWGGAIRLDVGEGPAVPAVYPDVLAVHEALNKLAQKDARAAHIVELRFFGGLNVEEVAGLLGCSKRTVEQEWTFIRAWMRRELGQGRR